MIFSLVLSVLSAPVYAESTIETETWTQLSAQEHGVVLRVAVDDDGTISGPVVITGAGIQKDWLSPAALPETFFAGAYTTRAASSGSVTVAISEDEVPAPTTVSVGFNYEAIDFAPERSFTDLASTQLAQPSGAPLLVTYGDDLVSFDHPIIAFDHPIIAFDHPIIASLVDEISGVGEGEDAWRDGLEETESVGDVVVVSESEQIALRCLDEAEGNYAGQVLMQRAADALAVPASGVLSVVVRQATVDTSEVSNTLTFREAEETFYTENVEAFIENAWLREGGFVKAASTLGDLAESDGETVWVVSVGFVPVD